MVREIAADKEERLRKEKEIEELALPKSALANEPIHSIKEVEQVLDGLVKDGLVEEVKDDITRKEEIINQLQGQLDTLNKIHATCLEDRNTFCEDAKLLEKALELFKIERDQKSAKIKELFAENVVVENSNQILRNDNKGFVETIRSLQKEKDEQMTHDREGAEVLIKKLRLREERIQELEPFEDKYNQLRKDMDELLESIENPTSDGT